MPGGRLRAVLFGPALLLVWLQCVNYARYVQVDSGSSTVFIDLTRCACIVLLLLLLWRGRFTPRFQRWLGWFSVPVMTLGTFLFFVQLHYPDINLTLPASVLSGIGLVWTGGMWVGLFARMSTRSIFVYGFGAQILASLVGIPLGIIPSEFVLLLSLPIPVASYLMFQYASKLEAAVPAASSAAGAAVSGAALTGAAAVSSEAGSESTGKDGYPRAPLSTWIRILLGIAISSFVIGASRGFPFGPSIQIGPPFQALQFALVIALSAISIACALKLRPHFSFSGAWWLMLLGIAGGVVLLSTYDSRATVLGATLIATVNLYRVSFMWTGAIDYAARYRDNEYLAVALVWFAHLFFRSCGRLSMLLFAQGETTVSSVFVAVLLLLLIACSALLLSGDIPHEKVLFCFDRNDGVPAAGASGATGASGLSGAAGSVGATGSAGAGDPQAATGTTAADPAQAQLQELYGLTQQEARVALLLTRGRTAAYIAEELSISPNTVRGYMRSLYSKMSVHSKQELIDRIHSL